MSPDPARCQYGTNHLTDCLDRLPETGFDLVMLGLLGLALLTLGFMAYMATRPKEAGDE